MGSFTSLAAAASGIRAAQVGLTVTGHNISNAEILGYSRQRVLQVEAGYQSIGTNRVGVLKRGLGTDVGGILQIRNEYLDLTYRRVNSKLNFYNVKSTVASEIETLLGETEGAYKFQDVIADMWNALHELSVHPDGVETRDYFLATASSFVNKANEVYDGLLQTQYNLDADIRATVDDINRLVGRISELNTIIRTYESAGDHANDYRDERNLCIDELSALIPIDCYTDSYGTVSIYTEGHQLLNQNSQNFMGLKFCATGYSFVEPVFTSSKTILPADTPPSEYEAYLNLNIPINAYRDRDNGVLLGLIVARGAMPAFYNGLDSLVMPTVPAVVSQPIEPASPLDPNDIPDPAAYDLTNPDGITAYRSALQAYENAYPGFDWANYDGNPATFINDPYVTTRFANLTAQYNLEYTQYQKDLTDYQQYLTDMRVYESSLHNYKFHQWSLENCMIPKTQMKLDAIVHSIVTMINDAVAPALNGEQDPNAPYDLYGNQSYVEVFVRNLVERWDNSTDPPTLIPEESGNYYSQYSIGNISLNPQLLDTEGGYNYLAFSLSGERGDTQLMERLLETWISTDGPYAIEVGGVKYGIQEAYRKFVTELAIEAEEANTFLDSLVLQTIQADNKRNTVMGVSMDEEMNNMMKYQYAFQAAARIFNIIDSMIDKVVNSTGRVGL